MLLLNFVLVLSLACSSVYCAEQQTSHKARRGGTVGLFPFPRVGRAQPGRSWMLSTQDLADLHTEMKRQGLIPFPRVGRSGSDPLGRKRAGSGGDAGGGMWFGPRLGRVAKRDPMQGLDDDAPWTMIALREVQSPRDFTPRLGRESEELQAEEDQAEQSENQLEQDGVRQKRQV